MKEGISAYTEIIVKEALARGIEVDTFEDIDRGIVRLTLDDHAELIDESSCDLLGKVSWTVFRNKALTLEFLKEQKVSTPDSMSWADCDQAV